jgi:predicted dehydrogenase
MIDRREFLKQSGVGLVVAGAARASQGQGQASDTLVIGAIGCGGRATGLLKSFTALKGVEVAFVCDPDQARADAAARLVYKLGGRAPSVVNDLRRVLDQKSVDAVIVATPDHWHAPAAILACDAGKHVYVEKPCSHNIREGQLLVEAARRTGRVVQHGTQSRSNPVLAQAVQMLREGIIGDVLVARAFDVQRRADIGHAAPEPPPAGFDYDLWVGPAPFVPFQKNRHHYSWHWWYNFGTGDMGNDGVHELDLARWGLGIEGHPSSVSALGGKYYFDDDQQFPDTQTVLFDYPGDGTPGHRRQIMFELRIWSPYQPDGLENAVAFYGTEGWMLASKSGKGVVKLFDQQGKPRPVTLEAAPGEGDRHQEDFVQAIRSGRRPHAEIGIGHVSATLAHLGNIATRLGRSLRFDPATEQIIGDEEAARMTRRSYREGHWAIPRGV